MDADAFFKIGSQPACFLKKMEASHDYILFCWRQLCLLPAQRLLTEALSLFFIGSQLTMPKNKFWLFPYVLVCMLSFTNWGCNPVHTCMGVCPNGYIGPHWPNFCGVFSVSALADPNTNTSVTLFHRLELTTDFSLPHQQIHDNSMDLMNQFWIPP